jgi:hypothetical protein
MDAVLTVAMFLVMTMPIALGMLLMMSSPTLEDHTHPSAYQPMELLNARAAAHRAAAEAAQASARRAA